MKLPVRLGISPTLGIRGILADEPIKAGKVIERAPVLTLPMREVDDLEKTTLSKYYYLWTEAHVAVVFGFGSLYNHSSEANVIFHRDFRNRCMVFTAVEDIAPGEECFVDYYQGSDEPVDPAYLDFNAHEKSR
jgi:hypothetical protein